MPIVFLDTPGDPYWEAVDEFVETASRATRARRPRSTARCTRITNSVDAAADEIERFYANYHSIRFVGDDLVIRLQQAPTDAQLAELNERFGHLATDGADPSRRAVRRSSGASDDHVELARTRLRVRPPRLRVDPAA